MGIFLLARGQPEGVAAFGKTAKDFNASIAPLIAFPLVGSLLVAIGGQPKLAAIAFVSRLCMVLAVAAITYEFARLTGREMLWLRTAIALNWSFWIIVPLLLAAGLCGMIFVSAGMPLTAAENLLAGVMLAYLLWYHWFTVRSGLQLKILPAIGLVLLTNTVVALLAIGPDLIDLAIAGHLTDFFDAFQRAPL
jgi:hypothetical protein